MAKKIFRMLSKVLFSTGIIFLLTRNFCIAQIDQNHWHVSKDNQMTVTQSGGQNSSKTSDEKNIIKINPFIYANGEVPVYYERFIYSWLSVEGAIGPTFRDQMQDIYNTIILDNGEKEYDLTMMHKNSTVEIGVVTKLSARFFPGSADDRPEGFYIGPYISYATHNLNFHLSQDDPGVPPANTNLRSHYFDAMLMMGYQTMPADNFIFDVYFGCGSRKRHVEYVTQHSDNFGFNFLSYDNEVIDDKVFRLALGFKLGVLF